MTFAGLRGTRLRDAKFHTGTLSIAFALAHVEISFIERVELRFSDAPSHNNKKILHAQPTIREPLYMLSCA